MGNMDVRLSELDLTGFDDFVKYCADAHKIYYSDLSNYDFVAFRTIYSKDRAYIDCLKNHLDSEIYRKEDPTVLDVAVGGSDEDLILLSSNDETTVDSPEEIHLKQNDEQITEAEYSLAEESAILQEDSVSIPLQGEKDYSSMIKEHKKRLFSKRELELLQNKGAKSFAELMDVSPEGYYNINIDVLFLGVRASNCLRREDISNIGQLLVLSEEKLTWIKNMGRKSVDEIIQKLTEYVKNHPVAKNTLIETHLFDEDDARSVQDYLQNADISFSDEDNSAMDNMPESVRVAIQEVGIELCRKALLEKDYCKEILETFVAFSTPYLIAEELLDDLREAIGELREEVSVRKLLPFLRAYSECEDILAWLEDEYDLSTASIRSLPRILEGLKGQNGFDILVKMCARFVQWVNMDTKELSDGFMESFYKVQEMKKADCFEIVALRNLGETLDKIGERRGVTRERIRQIEVRGYRMLRNIFRLQNYDYILLASALKDGKSYFFLEELKELYGEVADWLWYCVKQKNYSPQYHYSRQLDAVIIKGTDADLDAQIINLFEEEPQIIEVEKKEEFLDRLSRDKRIPKDLCEQQFLLRYKQFGQFWAKGRLTVVYMCDYILKMYFQGGYKVADDYEADRFRQYLVDTFGDKAGSITNRAIDAKVMEIGVLCDRGRYIHKDYLHVEPSVIEAVNKFVEQSPRALLPYGEIFESMKEVFEGTQITNRFILQGALKKYGCIYNTGRDFVRKSQSTTIVDELESFVEERGVVHKSEIFAEFKSIGEAGLGQVVARSANVFNIDGGYFIHASQFDIQPGDYNQLRKFLSEACESIPVNIRSVYDTVSARFPDFMFRNEFTDRNRLYAALNYMFKKEFQFSRPYIAKLGVGDVTNKSVVLQHINDYDTIDIGELVDICEENAIHFVAVPYLCQSIAPEYIRVNKTSLMKMELTGITDQIIGQTAELMKEMLANKDYIVGSKVDDYLWFPQTEVEWTDYLLESIITLSRSVNIINLVGDSHNHSTAIYVPDKFKDDTFNSFLIKVLSEKVEQGYFSSKVEMREWLLEEGLIVKKMPNCLEGAKYFFVDDMGVHRTMDRL